MNRNERHFTRFMRIALMLLMLMPTPAVWAQSPASQPATAQDVTIIIQQQQVRFTTRSAVAEMQLKVFDQTGEMVYDSGAVAEPELNWPLHDANGNTVKSGLYAYQLSIKEAGAETARVRRGHFIVDRAQDRDGADKLWVTSQDSSGVGTDLTVARDENATVAGTAIGERTAEQLREKTSRDSSGREIEPEARDQAEANKAAGVAAAAGTAGQIAKFTSGTDLGNSVMTEQNGNVGIGTTTPSGRLHIVGSAEAAGTLRFQPDTSKGPNHSHVHWGPKGDWYIRSAASNGNVILQDTGGNVGIGTDYLTSRLTIEGQDALTMRGYEPFLNLDDSNSSSSQGHRIQSAHGDLNFFYRFYSTFGQFPGYRYIPRMVIKDSGNVGIGTATPQAKLDVAGQTRTQSLQITGGADFAENFDVNIDDASLNHDICCHRVVGHRLRLEQELRDTLREIRRAIDAWHQACESGLVGPLDRRVDDQCYPPTLEALVEGIHPPNTNRIIRFLRRIPRDPITGKAERGLRSVQDARDSMTWGGQNVYDVYSKSDGAALDGTKYKDW